MAVRKSTQRQENLTEMAIDNIILKIWLGDWLVIFRMMVSYDLYSHIL